MSLQVYQVTQEKHSNPVIEELNASVLKATFNEQEKGVLMLGDLYTYEGTQCKNPNEIVAKGTCAPAMARFVKSVLLKF